MAITLEGGCRVSEMNEGTPLVHGTLTVWPQIGRRVGAQAISLRVLEFAPGVSPGLRNETCDEILYVLDADWDRGRPARLNVTNEPVNENDSTIKIFIDGWSYEVGPATGIYLRPGQTFTIDNPGPEPLVLISSQCPEPEASLPETIAPVTSPPSSLPREGRRAAADSTVRGTYPNRPPIVRLAERRATATADRWYRVLVDDEVGSAKVTQFVGSIPPGRAPDHFHTYEEVLFILHGTGRMWAGETHTPIAAGSCIYLPRGQTHCVENTGNDELRLLGVFYPAGSPSVTYDV